MKILINGWIDIYHSYAIVNYFQLKYLLRKKDLTIYFQQTKYYNPAWKPKFSNGLNLKKYNGEPIDLIFTISFPYIIYDTNVPQILFYTSESGYFHPEYFNKNLNEIKEFVNSKKLFLLTPSERSAKAFTTEKIPVKIIPHGYDPEIFYKTKSNFRKELNIPEESKVFLNISSMTGNKQLNLIVKAFSEAYLKDNNIFLILKGNTDLYNSIEFLKNQLLGIPIISTNIKVIDNSLSFEDINKLYNTADFYVDAGINEGFCMPVVEAIGCGLTIINNIYAPLSNLGNYNFNDIYELTDIFLNCEKQVPKYTDTWDIISDNLFIFFCDCINEYI